MASVNKVTILGNLGRDPELRSAGASIIASFSVATSDNWKGKDGTAQTRTEWHRVVAWGKLGELCQAHLSKGRQVYVEGRLQTRKWTNKEGKEASTTEIVADQVVFLGGAGRADGAEAPSAPPPGDEIPF